MINCTTVICKESTRYCISLFENSESSYRVIVLGDQPADNRDPYEVVDKVYPDLKTALSCYYHSIDEVSSLI